MLQDIYRTQRLIERFPDLRFNGDFSHYYCGHELTYRGLATTRAYFTPILARTAFLHGRISDGEAMQIDVGDGQANPHAVNFKWLWKTAMTFWLKQSQPGDILPFAPELGPPGSGYSLTCQGPDDVRVEISDRWAQTLVLRDLACSAFAEATTELHSPASSPPVSVP